MKGSRACGGSAGSRGMDGRRSARGGSSFTHALTIAVPGEKRNARKYSLHLFNGNLTVKPAKTP